MHYCFGAGTTKIMIWCFCEWLPSFEPTSDQSAAEGNSERGGNGLLDAGAIKRESVGAMEAHSAVAVETMFNSGAGTQQQQRLATSRNAVPTHELTVAHKTSH